MANGYEWTDIQNGEQASSVREKLNGLGGVVANGYNGRMCKLSGIERTLLPASKSSSTSTTLRPTAKNVTGEQWNNSDNSGFIVPEGVNWIKVYSNFKIDCTGTTKNGHILVQINYKDADNIIRLVNLAEWHPVVSSINTDYHYGTSLNTVTYPLNVLAGSEIHFQIVTSHPEETWYLDNFGYMVMEALG